jgi:hypothetical protein
VPGARRHAVTTRTRARPWRPRSSSLATTAGSRRA